MSGKILTLLLAVLLAGCAVQPTQKSLKHAKLPPLLPVRDFVANTDYNGFYRLSPDGTRLAWKAVAGTRSEIFVRTLGKDDTHSLGFGVYGYPFVWAQDSRHLLFIKDAGGNENFHLFRVGTDRPAQQPVDITPLKHTRVAIQQIIADDPAHILVLHNGRDKAVFDLYRLNLDSGKMTLLYRNDGQTLRLVTDRQGRLRARVRQVDGERRLELPQPDGTWRLLTRWSQDDDVAPLAFDASGKGLWMLSNRGRDKRALVRLDVASGKEQVVYAAPEVDVRQVQISKVSHAPVLAYTMPDYPHLQILDPALRQTLARIRQSGPVGIRVTSADDSEQRVTLVVNTDREVSHYLLERRDGKLTLLGHGVSHAYADELSSMRPVSFHARDGLTLHGYLTIPKGMTKGPLPMVLLVHGGPFARNIWRYNRLVQFLANRGYAVLQVNYRGSSGYGRTFMEKAVGEFAGKMHDDLLDGVAWAVREGIADPDHVAIMGASYGGYATLVGLTMSPRTFACGIDLMGPADLVSLTENFPVYWRPYQHRWLRYVGDPADPAQRARMRAKSPLTYAERVERPLLVIQGANDVRVKQDQSERMVAGRRATGRDVDYLVLSGEGHRIRHWPSRLKAYRATEDFLADCLGGRSSGFDYYQLGSWLF
jgi:dipeptidyl aminopeptidase/acylaminoacyl peptidase